jgi:MFS family permease
MSLATRARTFASRSAVVSLGLGPLVGLVSAVVFMEATFYALLVPLLPRLSHQLALGKQSVGILAGAYLFGMAAGSIPAGWLADRLGPRAVTLLGLIGLSASTLAFGCVHAFYLLLVTRVLQALGGALAWAGGMAWLLARAPPSIRGRVLGVALGVWYVGAAAGPLVGGLVLALGFVPVFVSLAVLSACLCVVTVRIPGPEPSAVYRPNRTRYLAFGGGLAGTLALLVAALVMGACVPLLPAMLSGLGAHGGVIALVFAVAGVAQGASALAFGRLTDRFGALLPVLAGLMSLALTVSVFALPLSVVALAAAIILASVALQLAIGPALAMIATAASAAGVETGAVWGTMNLTWAGGMFLGSVGTSALAAHTSNGTAWVILASLCLAASPTVLRIMRRHARTELASPVGIGASVSPP